MKIQNFFLIIFLKLIINIKTQENRTIWEYYLITQDNIKASNKQIKSLNGIEKLSYLKKIDLSRNEITNINQLEYLTSLTSLDLSINKIFDLNPLKNFKVLRHLHLRNNQIINIDSLRDLKSLLVLSLDNNQIVNIDVLGNLTELRALFLSNNKILNIDRLQNLKKLIHLNIFHNEIYINLTVFNLKTTNQLLSNLLNCSLTNEFVNQFKHVFIIDENMSYFKENINRKQSKNRKFLDAVYFLTINNLYYVDCNETVNFIKRNYHLNLFYDEQVQYFFNKCSSFEFQF